MKTTKIITMTLVLGLAFTALFFYTSKDTESKKEIAQLTIGAVYPLTGPAGSFGQIFKRGAELAAEEANKAGLQINLIVEDSKTDPKAALAAYRKLYGQHVNFFLTTVSSMALAIVPAATQDGVLLFTDVGYPGITDGHKLLFRHSSTAEQEARVIFNYFKNMGSTKKAGLLWMNDDYGVAFKKEFYRQVTVLEQETHAGITVHDISYAKTGGTLRPEALQILSGQPEVIVVAGFGQAMGMAIRRVRENGFTGVIIASMGFTVTPSAVQAAGDAAAAVLHTYMNIDDKDKAYQNFAATYKKRFGNQPPTFAILAYNSTNLLIDAWIQSDKTPQKVAENILARGTFNAPGEIMTVQPNGDILPPVVIREYSQVKNSHP